MNIYKLNEKELAKMENLNKLESDILNAIFEDYKIKYPFLKDHLNYLYVTKRNYTGVGIYIDFGYHENNLKCEELNGLISSTKKLYFKKLKNEISYVLDITDGKIQFLEIVTNGGDIINQNIEYEFNLE